MVALRWKTWKWRNLKFKYVFVNCRTKGVGWMLLSPTGLRSTPGINFPQVPFSTWFNFGLESLTSTTAPLFRESISGLTLKCLKVFAYSGCASRNLGTMWSSGSPWMSRRRRACKATAAERWLLDWKGQAHLSIRLLTTKSGKISKHHFCMRHITKFHVTLSF